MGDGLHVPSIQESTSLCHCMCDVYEQVCNVLYVLTLSLLNFTPTSNSLPIALMQSLTYTVDSLKWGIQDTRDAELGRALSYLVLFSTLGIILRWSYGIQLLSTADDEVVNDEERPIVVNERDAASTTNGRAASHDVTAPLLEEDEEGELNHSANGNGNGTVDSTKSPRFTEGPITVNRPPNIRSRPRVPERRWTAIGSKGDVGDVDFFGRDLTPAERKRVIRQEFSNFRSFPNTPTRTPAASSYASSTAATDTDEDEDSLDTDDEEYEGIGRRDGTAPSSSRWQAKFRKKRRGCMAWLRIQILQPLGRFWKGFSNFMTAPLYAALLSLVVGKSFHELCLLYE